MSLMGTLAKVAIGVAVVKGVGAMVQNRGSSGSATGGGMFGGPHSPGGSSTGLEDMMSDILGGKSKRPSGGQVGGSTQGGGIGDLLEELAEARGDAPASRSGTSQRGGIDDILGNLGGGTGGGGLGDLLGGILGGALSGGGGSSGGSFGDLLNQSMRNRGEPQVRPTAQQDAAAALMLRAMIQAAKADGKIDADEKRKLLGNLGEISAEEKRFVEAELAAPVDVRGLARQVPKGLEAQVYTMSVMAINLDNQSEAQYLHQLAGALGIDQRNVNAIHARLGVPALYA
ncbi:MAG: tellurite resistance TerB family protein [Rhodobacteraceae bacterium]|nr:tellurite resistance TerB family protein [Paracoccaceae bacterium]